MFLFLSPTSPIASYFLYSNTFAGELPLSIYKQAPICSQCLRSLRIGLSRCLCVHPYVEGVVTHRCNPDACVPISLLYCRLGLLYAERHSRPSLAKQRKAGTTEHRSLRRCILSVDSYLLEHCLREPKCSAT